MVNRSPLSKILLVAIGAALILTLTESCGKKSPDPAVDALFSAPGGVSVHRSVPENERTLLSGDLEALTERNFPSLSPRLTEILDLAQPSITGSELLDWLSARFKIVVGQEYSANTRLSVSSLDGAQPRVAHLQSRDGEKPKTMMRNYGAELYRWSRDNSVLLSVDLDAKKIPIYSPRVGLILAESIFSANDYRINGIAPESLGLRLARIACYFHEARHSDGNGENVGFMHVKCPPGHDYEGVLQCDTASNGPFALEASLLAAFYDNCDTCTTMEKQRIIILLRDARNRLLMDQLQKVDPRPEGFAGVSP